jgi:inward rectifier potassium channel
MLRMANARASQIVEATARLTLMREERTAEGTSLRRFYDLKLARAQSTVFALSWLLIHPITPDSPLHGVSLDEIRERGMYFIVSVIGLEDTFGQTVNARYTYWAEDVVYEARFADILTPLPDGRNRMDLTQFHEVVALPGSLAAMEKKSA